MFKKVLLPISADAEHLEGEKMALQKAREICEGELVLLHVMEAIAQTVGGENRQELQSDMESQGMHLLEPFIQELQNAGAHFHTRLVFGTAAEAIVQLADEENVDLIVMFTDGDDNLTDMFLGTITERVLRNTGKALLALRRPGS